MTVDTHVTPQCHPPDQPHQSAQTTTITAAGHRNDLLDAALRLLPFLCALGVVAGSVSPWLTWELGRNEERFVTGLGVWWPEGKVALALGVIACLAAAWRLRQGNGSRASLLVLALTFSAVASNGVLLQTDVSRMVSFPDGSWSSYEPRWGLTLTLVSAIAGCAVSLVSLLQTFLPTTTDVANPE